MGTNVKWALFVVLLLHVKWALFVVLLLHVKWALFVVFLCACQVGIICSTFVCMSSGLMWCWICEILYSLS